MSVGDPQVRRFFAFAVSRTEDPRDGFHQWITTETNYSDWPRVTAQDGVLIVAHNSYQTAQWREGPKPAAYVFSLDSLRTGLARPASHKIFPLETGGAVSPVVNLAATPGRWHHLLRRTDEGVEMYSFATPSNVPSFPALQKSVADVDTAPPGIGAFAVRRGGFLYIAGSIEITPRQPNVRTARYSVFYADDRGLQRSRVLQRGEFRPRTVWKNETDSTDMTFVAPRALDYATAAVDPADDRTVWMAHAFADSTRKRFSMVVGRVKP